MLNNRKNKHYRAADDDDEFDERRPLKIQKIMMMKKRDDPPHAPPPPSIRSEEEESMNNNRSVGIGVRSVRMMTMKEKEDGMEVPWNLLTPQVLQLIVKRMQQFDYVGVCKSLGLVGPKPIIHVVIQLDLGGGGIVSNLPLSYSR